MNKLQKISRMIYDANYRFNILSSIGLYNNIDDEVFLRRKYKSVFGKEINLENPETFSEKNSMA